MENKPQNDSTEEIAFARELLVNLWQFRAVLASEKERMKLVPIIADFTFRDEKDLREPVEFLIEELNKSLKQIKSLD